MNNRHHIDDGAPEAVGDHIRGNHKFSGSSYPALSPHLRVPLKTLDAINDQCRHRCGRSWLVLRDVGFERLKIS